MKWDDDSREYAGAPTWRQFITKAGPFVVALYGYTDEPLELEMTLSHRFDVVDTDIGKAATPDVIRRALVEALTALGGGWSRDEHRTIIRSLGRRVYQEGMVVSPLPWLGRIDHPTGRS